VIELRAATRGDVAAIERVMRDSLMEKAS